MLICTVLMLGQMGIAVPVLPLPPQGLGKAYVSVPRLPWVSCQRLRCGMQMRKRVLFQKPHIGKIPPSLAEGGGHGGPCGLLSCAPSAFWGSAGVARADAWASYISVPWYVLPTHATSPSAPRKSLWLRHRGKTCHCRTAYFCLQAQAQRPSELCPRGLPRGSSSQPNALVFHSLLQELFPPDLTKLSCFGHVIWKLDFFGLMLRNLSLHLPA